MEEIYTKGKVNKLALKFYDPSLYWVEAEVEYEVTLKAVSFLIAIKRVEVVEETYIEILLIGFLKLALLLLFWWMRARIQFLGRVPPM